MTDNTRTNISLLVSAVLIIPIILGSLYLQGVFSPDYQFTPSDTLVMAFIILGFFCILYGFIYWFIGYWQDTKEIGLYGAPVCKTIESEPVEDEDQEPEQEPEPVYEEPEREHHHKYHIQEITLKDEGLRQFNDNDDWINMEPGN